MIIIIIKSKDAVHINKDAVLSKESSIFSNLHHNDKLSDNYNYTDYKTKICLIIIKISIKILQIIINLLMIFNMISWIGMLCLYIKKNMLLIIMFSLMIIILIIMMNLLLIIIYLIDKKHLIFSCLFATKRWSNKILQQFNW